MVKAIPHRSDKLPPRNRHSLCMPHGSDKLWRIALKGELTKFF